KRTDFDKVSLEVETDGTITPEDALNEALKILISQFAFLKDDFFGAEDVKEVKPTKEIKTEDVVVEEMPEVEEKPEKKAKKTTAVKKKK
ncbi:hypothetical protein M0Q03_00400, partial [bacterium]|nr:hypothetical protein [bacterium]